MSDSAETKLGVKDGSYPEISYHITIDAILEEGPRIINLYLIGTNIKNEIVLNQVVKFEPEQLEVRDDR